jgi:hypothetical protein
LENNPAVVNDEDKSIKRISGSRPSADDVEWIKFGHDLAKQSPDLANNIAKDLITLNTSLITVYTGALAFLKIPGKINILLPTWLSWILVASPIILWLLSIHNNVAVYSVRLIKFEENNPEEIRKAIENVTIEKFKSFNKGKIFFFIAILIASFIIITGCSFNQTRSVQFVINKDYSPVFENMSIDVDNQSMTTTYLTLLDEDEVHYKVRLSNGKIISFSKNLVTGIIYY